MIKRLKATPSPSEGGGVKYILPLMLSISVMTSTSIKAETIYDLTIYYLLFMYYFTILLFLPALSAASIIK